jgi:hypothetical protein
VSEVRKAHSMGEIVETGIPYTASRGFSSSSYSLSRERENGRGLRRAGSARSRCVEINQCFFDGDTGIYARELRRAGLALVETKLCSSRCLRRSVQGHGQRPLRLGIVSSFVMKPIGEPGAQGIGTLYCLTATSFVLFVGVGGLAAWDF